MAATMLRKFGFKKSEPRESEARLKLQKELFAFTKCVEHGFPHKPSSLAYDPKLRLIAIGTKTGAIRVLGQPGVEFSGQHGEDVSVLQLFFLPGQARLISVCSDNSLHLWEINIKDGSSIIEHVLEFSMEASKLKTISSCCLTADCEQLLMGTEGGNIHLLDTSKFQLNEHVIYQDVVMQNVPDDFKVNPGAVEAIAQHPTDPTKFLIGYNRGLIVLWDSKENNAEQTYNATQQLESLAWQRGGTQFMSAHSDGSYTIWSVSDSTKPMEQATTPYGPFPCKAINKISWKTTKTEPFIIFSGGMPRASYGDRHTVSVMQGNAQAHVVFEFTSRVVDFVTLCTSNETEDVEKMEYDSPHSVLVLAEEELVAVDLETDGWPCFKLPYLCSLHSSAITCAQHVGNIPEQLSSKIIDAGEQQMPNFSTRDWPIRGGTNLQQWATKDLLLTGHEDGSIRFWDVSGVAVSLLYKLQTMNILGDGQGEQGAAEADEEWPPFRKVGTFDPYSDDPRYAIQKIVLCPFSETLVVAGTAGQVIVFELSREEQEQEVKVASVNVVSDRDNFVWKGHKALSVKNGELKFPAGFQPMCVVQVQPPAACTALALHPEWQLVAVGTAHGFGVFDYIQRSQISSKCTLNPSDLTGTGESAMSRRKSFKKSLRESFRRLRGRRSSAQGGRRKTTDSPSKPEERAESRSGATEGATAASAEGSAAHASEGASAAAAEAPSSAIESPKPVERQVEARSTDDAMASMVRVLTFYDTFLINGQSHTPTLWAGTNAGTVYIYQITMPASDKRDSEAVQCQIAKEIQLKHHAPVISICVIDRNAQPLPAPLEVQHERVKAPDMSGSHQVLLCSEEQFKIFSLPSLKANNKYKLTAHEGSKVRRVGYVNFRSRSDERYSENDLVCLTNQGDIEVFTLPQLRRQLKESCIRKENVRQLKESCIRKENVSGIVSNVFARNGEGYFLSSPSEFVRYSLSARFIPKPMCMVELKEGMRKPREEPPVVEVAVVEAVAETQASGDAADRLNESEKQDESTAEPANDSLAVGDITADSVKIHITEKVDEVVDGCATKVEGVITKTFVTKTTVVSETLDNAVTMTKETVSRTVDSTVDQAAAAIESVNLGAFTARGANVDDDTKLNGEGTEEGRQRGCVSITLAGAALLFTLHLHSLISFSARLYLQVTESLEPTDLLEELHITEEGDDDASPSAAATPDVNTTLTENQPKLDIPKVVIVAPDDSSDLPNDDGPSLVDDVTAAVAVAMSNHDGQTSVDSDAVAVMDNKTTVDGTTESTTSNSVCRVSETMS